MNIKRLTRSILIKLGSLLIYAGNFLDKKITANPVLLKAEGDRGLYALNDSQLMWLKNEESFVIDNCLIKTGTWEPQVVNILKKYLKPW